MNESVVFAAQKIFKQNTQRKRELTQIRDAIFLERFQAMYFKILRPNAQRVTRAKRISCGDGHPLGPFKRCPALHDNRNRITARAAILVVA